MSEELILRAIDTANVFDSAETAAGYLNPQIWNKKIEEYAQANLILAPLGVQNEELMSKPGKQLNIATGVALTAGSLTETTSITVQKPDFGQVTVTPTEYGGGFQITRKEMDRAFINLVEEKAADAGYALAKAKDDAIASDLNTNAGNSVYVNDKASSSIASTDVFETDAIADAITEIRKDNFDANYLVIHPHQEGYLMKDSQFVNAATYGGREVVLNGEIGKYLGLKVFSTTVVPTATETGITVYKAFVLGPRAFVVATKRKPTIDSKYEPLDRAFTVAYVEDWGESVLNANQICTITSA
jgi:N4-gp56 family major capsid protein